MTSSKKKRVKVLRPYVDCASCGVKLYCDGVASRDAMNRVLALEYFLVCRGCCFKLNLKFGPKHRMKGE